MKKRLLITSIVMMLVVAVALGTSTYAWFTSNATVTANSITLTAATNGAAALGISWTDGNYNNTLTATASEDAFSPVAPEALTIGTTTSEVDFYTAPTRSEGGVFKFTGEATEANAYTWTNGTQTSFFIKNLSPSNNISGAITMTATINDATGASNVGASNLVRIGVFKKDTSSGTYKLIAVLAKQDANTYTGISAGEMTAGTYYKLVNGQYIAATQATSANEDPTEAAAEMAAAVAAGTADWYVGMSATASQFYTSEETPTNAKAVYGSVTVGDPVNSMTSLTCSTSVDITGGSGLAANTAIELVVIVWEDGAALGDSQQGKVASVQLNFNA